MGKKLIQALSAFLAGLVVVNFGLAGGMILVPALMYAGDKIKKATATSLAIIAFISLSGTYQHLDVTHEFVISEANIFLLTTAVLGAILGAVLLNKAKNKTLTLLTTIYFFIVGVILVFSVLYNEIEFLYELPKQIYWIMGLPIAFVSTLFGIGSGAMLIPALIYGFNATPKEAVAMTMPFIFILTFTTTIVSIKNKLVDHIALVIMVPFALAGSLSAYTVNMYVSNEHVQLGVGALMLLSAFVMTIRSISRS